MNNEELVLQQNIKKLEQELKQIEENALYGTNDFTQIQLLKADHKRKTKELKRIEGRLRTLGNTKGQN